MQTTYKRQPTFTLLVGPIGSGKSTFAKELEEWAA